MNRIVTAAVAIAIIGLGTACGTSTGTSSAAPPPKSVAAATTTTPPAVSAMLKWMSTGNMRYLNRVDKDLTALSNDTAAGTVTPALTTDAYALEGDTTAALARPLPVSADPQGAYAQALTDFHEAAQAIIAGDITSGGALLNRGTTQLGIATTEIKAATP